MPSKNGCKILEYASQQLTEIDYDAFIYTDFHDRTK